MTGATAPVRGLGFSYTGTVELALVLDPGHVAGMLGMTMTFSPGARTGWHGHPLGQFLTVTHGCGVLQTWGSDARLLRTGDTVWIEPGEKHWHGAVATLAMTQLAVQSVAGDEAATLFAPVGQKEYETALSCATVADACARQNKASSAGWLRLSTFNQQGRT